MTGRLRHVGRFVSTRASLLSPGSGEGSFPSSYLSIYVSVTGRLHHVGHFVSTRESLCLLGQEKVAFPHYLFVYVSVTGRLRHVGPFVSGRLSDCGAQASLTHSSCDLSPPTRD